MHVSAGKYSGTAKSTCTNCKAGMCALPPPSRTCLRIQLPSPTYMTCNDISSYVSHVWYCCHRPIPKWSRLLLRALPVRKDQRRRRCKLQRMSSWNRLLVRWSCVQKLPRRPICAGLVCILFPLQSRHSQRHGRRQFIDLVSALCCREIWSFCRRRQVRCLSCWQVVQWHLRCNGVHDLWGGKVFGRERCSHMHELRARQILGSDRGNVAGHLHTV